VALVYKSIIIGVHVAYLHEIKEEAMRVRLSVDCADVSTRAAAVAAATEFALAATTHRVGVAVLKSKHLLQLRDAARASPVVAARVKSSS